jgi:hypothetical protein
VGAGAPKRGADTPFGPAATCGCIDSTFGCDNPRFTSVFAVFGAFLTPRTASPASATRGTATGPCATSCRTTAAPPAATTTPAVIPTANHFTRLSAPRLAPTPLVAVLAAPVATAAPTPAAAALAALVVAATAVVKPSASAAR